MKRILGAALAALTLLACSQQAPRQMSDPVDYVNTLVGTASTFALSTGNTYPATAVPWGMNFWTPQTGKDGENRATQYLISKGFAIIERNWRTKGGEIDIIAYKNDIIAFVEVKTLPNGTRDMIQRELNYQKRQRIIKTSKRFLLKHREYSNSYVRFDVIVIDMPGLDPVYHIENAFSE